MKKLITLITITITVLLLINPSAASAQESERCTPLFGGGPSCVQQGDLSLDKKLRDPATNQFIDGGETAVAADQTVRFQITVRNTGSRTIENIVVTDIFPQYVAFSKGPGQFDKEANTLTYPITRLEAGQTNTITIDGKVSAASSLPQTNGIHCVVNQATATQGRNTGSDTTQFCLQTAGAAQTPPTVQTTPSQTGPQVKQAPKVSTSPKTGPEMLALIGLLPAGITGLYLRRKTNR